MVIHTQKLSHLARVYDQLTKIIATISVASPKYGAGQQCCYDSNGSQVLTGDSIGGSTPDRAHDWGSAPYDRPPYIPGQSHWLYDVLSFYYCCLWSDNCQYYFKHRPSSDCSLYKTPSTGRLAQRRPLAPLSTLCSFHLLPCFCSRGVRRSPLCDL